MVKSLLGETAEKEISKIPLSNDTIHMRIFDLSENIGTNVHKKLEGSKFALILIHYSYFNVSVSKPSTLYRTVRDIANIDRPSFIAELSSVSEFSSVENANQFCDLLRTVIDKHAPPSLRKVIAHNSSPWFESIRDELFIAKRKRRQAERKWRNTKLTIFKDLYRQAKHKVSKLVYSAKCKFYTEGIALASSSKELHQIDIHL